MRTETEAKLNTIKKCSRIVRRVCMGLFGLYAFFLLASVAAALVGRGASLHISGDTLHLQTLTLRQRLIVAAIVVCMIATVMKGLYHLQRLFGNYAEGSIFTTENAGEIRQLGVTILVWAVVSQIWKITFGILTQPHIKPFDLHADSIVIGLFVMLIATFMDMAAEIREENELTI